MSRKTQKIFDTIIVGSGPGGATTANELSRKGKKVLILEWGTDVKLNGSLRQYITHQLVPSKSLLVTGQISILKG